MSFNAVFFLIVYVGGAVLAFAKDPIFGLLAYVFQYYHDPNLQWWGAPLSGFQRWSFAISVLTLIAYFVKRGSIQPASLLKTPPVKWWVMFLGVALLTHLWAVSPRVSWWTLVKLGKYTLLYFLIVKLVKTPKHYKMFMWVHLFGLFHWGWTGFTNPEMKAGRLKTVIAADGGNTLLGPRVASALPFLGFYALAGSRWEKALAILCAPFIVNLLILMNSRGAVIAAGVAGIACLFLSKGKHRLMILIALVLGGLLAYQLADERFVRRQLTTFNYQGESSASGRVEVWKRGVEIIKDHPMGLGGGGFESEEIVMKYGLEVTAHNTYILVGADFGLPGLFFYCCFLMSNVFQLHRFRARLGQSKEDNRLRIESYALESTMLGTFVGIFFINRIHGELIHWLSGLIGGLIHFRTEEATATADEASVETATEKKAPRGIGNPIANAVLRIKVWRAQQQFRE